MTHFECSGELWKALQGVCEDEGLELYDLESPSQQLLRVTVNKADTAVTSGDTSRLCKRLSVYLTVEGSDLGVREDVQIEVSSPGINRALRLPEHFRAAKGERVKVVLKAKPSLVGELEQADERGVTLKDEGSNEQLFTAYEDIVRAHVDFKW